MMLEWLERALGNACVVAQADPEDILTEASRARALLSRARGEEGERG